MKSVIALVLLSVYTILVFVAYMPQILKLLKTKSADDLSLSSWITWITADLAYLAYALLESPGMGIMFIIALDLMFLTVVIYLTAHYQKHNKRKKHK